MPDDTQRSPMSSNVKDIVVPLVFSLAFGANMFFMGTVWENLNNRMDILEMYFAEEKIKNSSQGEQLQALRDRTRDLERDNKDQDRRFLLLDDYTRGRIDHMKYKAPPPAKW